MWDVDSGGTCAWVGKGGIWEISIPSTQFCCETKTALKIKFMKSEKNKIHEIIIDQFHL